MKRLLVFTLVVCSFFVGSAMAQDVEDRRLPTKGYGGEASVALGFVTSEEYGERPLLDVSTTHGYWFSPRFYLAAGVSTFNTVYMTFYGQVLWTLRPPTVERPSYPILALRAGYTLSTWAGDKFADHTGLYSELKFGWSFYSKAGKLRYNVFAAVHMFSLKFVPKIGVAFEF